MKGIVLAGGLGTRLHPLTKITNKHLLPVYDKPMIYYPIQTLVNAGIDDIMLVTGGNKAGDFLQLLGNGSQFGLRHLNYTYQEREGGIAEAVGLCENFVGISRMVIILGDNIIEKGIKSAVEAFGKQERGARILLKRVKNPREYGIAEIEDSRIVRIVEKPKEPKSDLAVIGVYMYDNRVFELVKGLSLSARGDLEITDVNNLYLEREELTYSILEGHWADAGESIDALLETNVFVKEHGVNKESR